MALSLVEKERQFLGAQLGLSGAAMAKISVDDLRSQFYTTMDTKSMVTVPNPRTAVAAPTAAGAIYVQATAQSSVDAINAIRTALTNAGILA